MSRSPLHFSGAAFAALAISCSSGDELPFTGSGGASASGSGGASGGAAPGGAGGTTTASTSNGGVGGSTTGSGGAGAGGGNNGFPDHWPDGASCDGEPEVTVWSYDDDTFILRQSLCTNFEAPFLYLLFGEDEVLLQDTGTGDADVAGAVAGVIAQWLAKKGKASIPLLVTHSHSHGDHVGGDGQFAGMPGATVLGTSVNEVASFFGVSSWPTQIVKRDLGGRTLDIIPIPGHQKAHIALYDQSRGLLLTGDTLYPGRLYISDWSAYGPSIQRLADFTASPEHPVTWVLGTHIEMTTTPGQDYAMQVTKHPNEHVLQLTHGTLLELNQAVIGLGQSPQYQKHDDFILYPL